MVALGESTTAGGWSTSRERCWVSVLASLINDFQSRRMEFVNAGIGANVISTRSPAYEKSGKPAANERLGKHVIAHRPDLLIISYGLNDARGGTPLKLSQTELTSVIKIVRERIQPLIMLLGPYYIPRSGNDPAPPRRGTDRGGRGAVRSRGRLPQGPRTGGESRPRSGRRYVIIHPPDGLHGCGKALPGVKRWTPHTPDPMMGFSSSTDGSEPPCVPSRFS